MTKRTKVIGYQTGGSSDKRIAPQKPYTGNGKTTRIIFDGIKLIFKKGNRPAGQ